MGKSIPEMSVDTRLLYQRLAELQPGETITYEALSALVGHDVQRRRQNLTSARNKALNEDGIVTEAVAKVGIKRLTDHDNVSGTGEALRSRVRRATGKAVRKLMAVDFAALTQEDKIRQNAELSQISALKAFAKDHYTARLEAEVKKANVGMPLPLGRTLDSFKD